MDKITRQVRIEHWTQIMNECLNSGMNKTEWCRANGISDKQFFYWQRILRKEAFAASTSKELSVITDPADETSLRKISFAEISLPIKQEPVRNGFQPDIIIRKVPRPLPFGTFVTSECISNPPPRRVRISSRLPPSDGIIPHATSSPVIVLKVLTLLFLFPNNFHPSSKPPKPS